MDFQSEKSFGKRSFRAFQQYHQILCILKIITISDGMVGKPYVSAFQNFFRIENPLNIKQVMSKNVSDNNNAAMLLMSHVGDVGDVKYLNKRSKATLYKAMLLMSEMSEM